ncbi:MAG: hypothetical protein ABJK39_00230 [Hyphomicrobiales bacterium]
MEIVSKRHNRYETKRIQPVAFVKDAANDERAFEERALPNTPRKPSNHFAGHSAIVAQIIVSREDETVINGFNAAQTLAGNAGYGEALDRKQVRMETGSFLADAA